VGKNDRRDKTRLEEFSDEELDAFGEAARSLLVEAELKRRLAQYQIAVMQEELECRKSGRPRRSAEDWEKHWNSQVEEVAKDCNVDLGYVAEIALKLSKEK
jgi:hypothetical protein